LLERFSFEKLEDEERDALLVTDVMKDADIGVIQLRNRARFALESVAELRVALERLWQDLDGDCSIKTDIARAIDLAHAARAERREDLVRAELCSGCQRHSGDGRVSYCTVRLKPDTTVHRRRRTSRFPNSGVTKRAASILLGPPSRPSQ